MTLSKEMLPAAMLALALMGPHAGSQAGTLTTQHGSGCKSYGWTQSGRGYTNVAGIWNVPQDWHRDSISVVCPVTRVGPESLGGLRVWIDGIAPEGTVVTCQLWSFDYKGLLLAWQSFDLISTGAPFDKSLELTSASVPMYSSQVVTCTLPPDGRIYDIEPISL